ncbi:MAG: GNAT family N-acetyltransferase [Crocinitomicaceae bacterium]|nr:GNAT family N-acetyltransferase [Crocinitomicaceae bacterium]
MRKATNTAAKEITDIISDSFYTNPSVNTVTQAKNDDSKRKKIKALAKFAFKTGLRRDGVYFSSDEKGVAICYRFNAKKESIQDYLYQIELVVTSIGLKRLPAVLRREKYIKSRRPKSSDYLYFWFFGVDKDARGRGAAIELKNAIFEEAEKDKLPIYLETSVEKNKQVYERYGFEVYHTWKDEGQEYPLWFMRKE